MLTNSKWFRWEKIFYCIFYKMRWGIPNVKTTKVIINIESYKLFVYICWIIEFQNCTIFDFGPLSLSYNLQKNCISSLFRFGPLYYSWWSNNIEYQALIDLRFFPKMEDFNFIWTYWVLDSVSFFVFPSPVQWFIC